MVSKIISILEYIMAICIVINTNTVWSNDSRFDNLILIFLVFIIVISILLSINIILNKKYFFKEILFIICIFVYNLGYVLLSNDKDNIKRYIIIFILFLILLIIYYFSKSIKGKKYDLLIKISNVIVILSIISLFFYIFGTILGKLNPNSNTLLNWGNERYIPNYYNLYYETQQIEINGMLIFRNTGIFTEAPMFSFALSIALIIKLFFDNKKNRLSIFILSITIFTTFSTTGVVIILLAFLMRWMFKNSKKDLSKIIKISIIPVAMIISIFIFMFFYTNKQQTDSYSIRMDDYIVALKAWSEHPIVGNGFGTISNQIMKYTNVSRPNYGGSSGFNSIISDGGIYMSLMYFTPFIVMLIYSLKNKNRNKTIAICLFLLLLVTTSVSYRGIMINLLAIMWSETFELLVGKKEYSKEYY